MNGYSSRIACILVQHPFQHFIRLTAAAVTLVVFFTQSANDPA